MGKQDHPPGLQPVRTFPYLKLQFWDDNVCAWKDVGRKFTDRESALGHAIDFLPPDRRVRLMIVVDRKTRRVFEEIGRLGDLPSEPVESGDMKNSGAGT